jgi:hypothetical protein
MYHNNRNLEVVHVIVSVKGVSRNNRDLFGKNEEIEGMVNQEDCICWGLRVS